MTPTVLTLKTKSPESGDKSDQEGESQNIAEIQKLPKGQWKVLASPSYTESFSSLEDALQASPLQSSWENLEITTKLPLASIERKILRTWGPWVNGKIGVVRVNNEHFRRATPKALFPQEAYPGVSLDTKNDKVGLMLKKLSRIKRNSREYKEFKEATIGEMKKSGYYSWEGDTRDLGGLNIAGMSVLYKVPLDKRGHLAAFKGQEVRVCCVGAGSYAIRYLMAGPIGKELKVSKDNSYLAPIKIGNPKDTPLLLALSERDLKAVDEAIKIHKCNPLSTPSEVISQLAQEGNLEILKILAKNGVDLAEPKENPEPGSPNKYWHGTLSKIAQRHWDKVPEFLKLYTSKALKDISNLPEGVTYLHPGLPPLAKTEERRRTKREIQKYLDRSTLELPAI